MESEMRLYHELFTEEYFAIAESTRTNCTKDLSSLYALSKLKYSKHCWYLNYLLLLLGYINLHLGQIQEGSILGPLLFLLYVNDMPQAVNSELLLYADDTCLI